MPSCWRQWFQSAVRISLSSKHWTPELELETQLVSIRSADFFVFEARPSSPSRSYAFVSIRSADFFVFEVFVAVRVGVLVRFQSAVRISLSSKCCVSPADLLVNNSFNPQCGFLCLRRRSDIATTPLNDMFQSAVRISLSSKDAARAKRRHVAPVSIRSADFFVFEGLGNKSRDARTIVSIRSADFFVFEVLDLEGLRRKGIVSIRSADFFVFEARMNIATA